MSTCNVNIKKVKTSGDRKMLFGGYKTTCTFQLDYKMISIRISRFCFNMYFQSAFSERSDFSFLIQAFEQVFG